MWMLTDERKNELANQRDTKLSELASLEAETPESLWETDLKALDEELRVVQKKERQKKLSVEMNLKTAKQTADKQNQTETIDSALPIAKRKREEDDFDNFMNKVEKVPGKSM